MDCGRTGLRCGVDDSVGTCGRGSYLRSVDRVHGREPVGVEAFLVLAGSDRKTQFFYGCHRAGFWTDFLFCIVAQLAVMDQVRRHSLVSDWNGLRCLYDQGIPGTAADVRFQRDVE